MTLRTLVLLRHGQTDWNLEWRMQGHTDIGLNEVGRVQARAATDVIMSSDLIRAAVSRARIADLLDMPVSIDKRLRETHLGEWEGLTRDDLVARWPERWDEWRGTTAHARPPGGETRYEVALRAAEVVDELDAGGAEHALLVAHGGLIVGLTGYLLELPDAVWSKLIGVNNCHWVALHRRHDRWSLHAYNAGLEGMVLPGAEDEVPGA